MASQQINVNVQGKDSTKSAFDSVANNIKRIGKEAATAGSFIGSGISRGASTASAAMAGLGRQASSTFGMIRAGASAASQSLGGLGSAVASLAGGFGVLEMATMVFGGAAKKQFSEAELAMKVGNERAKELSGTIQQIVAETPGDDTYMNQLLSGMLAKQTNLTNNELRTAGFLASDYIIKSRSVGKTMLETQMDLKEYLQTGNTGQLERDSILKMQLDKLKGQGTVSERILALDKAMKAEGFAGLSQLDVALIKWDTLKGKIQLAATTIGERLLPPIEAAIKWLLEADKITNGWSTMIGFAAAGIVLLGVALGPVIAATLSAYAAMKLYRIEAERAGAAPMFGGKTGIATSVGGLIVIADLINGIYKAWSQLSYSVGQTNNLFTQASATIMTFVNTISPIHMIANALAGVDTSLAGVHMTAQKTSDAFYGFYYSAKAAIDGTIGKWNQLKAVIGFGIRVAINIGTGAITAAYDAYMRLRNSIMNNPIVQRIITVASSGASAVSNVVSTASSWVGSAWNWLTGARGPGDVKYQDYPGYTGRNAWQSDGTLSGNCVDMSVGLVQRYGGELVNGTWNGGLHTWWRAPDGREYDPSRKALNNTWAPPNSRGPGDGSGVTYVFNAPVYGYDDFQKKVEQVNNRIVSGVF
jgi:hypothetical protein